jgi:hypothetical protein
LFHIELGLGEIKITFEDLKRIYCANAAANVMGSATNIRTGLENSSKTDSIRDYCERIWNIKPTSH